MKKVIDGKMYNTETAECLHEWDNGHYTNDFAYCSEDLYITKKGVFFLHGGGGAMSKYAVSHGNSTGGSNQIEVLTEAEAITWLADHDAEDVLAERFPDKIEEA